MGRSGRRSREGGSSNLPNRLSPRADRDCGHPDGAVTFYDLYIRLASVGGFIPDDSCGSAIVSVPDADALYASFARRLDAVLRQAPSHRELRWSTDADPAARSIPHADPLDALAAAIASDCVDVLTGVHGHVVACGAPSCVLRHHRPWAQVVLAEVRQPGQSRPPRRPHPLERRTIAHLTAPTDSRALTNRDG